MNKVNLIKNKVLQPHSSIFQPKILAISIALTFGSESAMALTYDRDGGNYSTLSCSGSFIGKNVEANISSVNIVANDTRYFSIILGGDK